MRPTGSKLDRIRADLAAAEAKLKTHPANLRAKQDVDSLQRLLTREEAAALKKHWNP